MAYTIGLDLGGTNSVFGIVDEQGIIHHSVTVKTAGHKDAESYVNACIDALLPIIKEAGGLEVISSMGIGAPNGNINTGSIDFAPNIAWAHTVSVPIAQMFSEKLGGLAVKVTNDANAAALGEMKFGAAKGMKNFIVITLGTGVGSGIVCNGKLVSGSDGMAGELGHMIVKREGGRLCGCGRYGCLETYCSATGVARTARHTLKATTQDSLLRKLKPEEIDSYQVSLAAQQGDELAKQIYQRTGDILGAACAEMTVFSSPEAFIFFGGMAKAGELLMAPLRESYEKNVMPIFKGKAKFLMSALDSSNAAVLGAASL